MHTDTANLLRNLLDKNGYVDEFIGSWHRYVDAQEKIATALTEIAEKVKKEE